MFIISFIKRFFIFLFIVLSLGTVGFGQSTVLFQASDLSLENAFNWAKSTALSYQGNPNDPVGPWYEAALPGRYAFCIRDVGHQCIGAEILGMSRDNKNMIQKFVSNISKSKNWCSYWEIDKWNHPAPVDYKNDSAFWYNLNANFEVIYASWRLYQWTGDKTYITNQSFKYFCEKSLNEYIKEWVLEVDSLITRPTMPNEPKSYDKNDTNDLYHVSRGLPSYIENVPNIKMSLDLVAAIYQGLASYSSILKVNGNLNLSRHYAQMANKYKSYLNTKWWDNDSQKFYAYYTDKKGFGNSTGRGNVFLLWYDVVDQRSKKEVVVQDLITSKSVRMETLSYVPYVLYLNGYNKQAYKYLLYLSNPATKRREYPEVSYGVIEGIIQGMMGIEPNAHTGVIGTLYRGEGETELKVNNLPILGLLVNIQYSGSGKTLFQNNGTDVVYWKAKFSGKHAFIHLNGKRSKAKIEKDSNGNTYSFVTVAVRPKQKMEASVKLIKH